MRGSASRDDSGVAIATATELIAVDPAGVVRWRRPVWRVLDIAWSPDDRHLVVGTIGGLERYDARTGERVAVACGWGFGLSETERTGHPFNQPSVCAAPNTMTSSP